MKALQEKMCRGMKLVIRDESDDEREGEGQVDQEEEEFLNPKEENIFKAISNVEKDLSSMLPYFTEILT